ncbi:hypothetical protein PPACK8108_LOCUS10008 [Phakopsora pachyrhizi]|uniref:Uncharacterized protein n=1 Tax=Phakopsora pachyrhizi TaxID=170000 RepID=A0AAV0AXJ4_PHAPC|nr:hypothetical protein PPACK8108_LOCUS10008 [Phakopsora pachyrhizi]
MSGGICTQTLFRPEFLKLKHGKSHPQKEGDKEPAIIIVGFCSKQERGTVIKEFKRSGRKEGQLE